MKFTTAIALTALFGNAAFSSAQDANGNLDICNPDKATYDANKFGCQKTCERPQTGIRNQVKIQCKVDLDGKTFDCFDPTVSADGCKEVDVKIQYKFMNTNKDLELVLMYGSYLLDNGKKNKKESWTAFDGEQVLEQKQTANLRLPGNEAKKFNIVKTINTCTPYDVEIKSKMPVPDSDDNNVKAQIRAAQSGKLYQVQQRIQNTCNAHPDYLAPNPPCSPLDLSTDRCGVRGKILLCDADCKADWEAKQDANPSPTPPEPTIQWTPVANKGSLYDADGNVDANQFRTIWASSPNQILYRKCLDCVPSHQDIYYRRFDGDSGLPSDLDLLDTVKNNWFDNPNNIFNVDFKLYSSYADALNDTNSWTFCNFNDPGVGFPRDCGPTGSIGYQWNSFVGRGGQTNIGFYVETPQQPTDQDGPSSPSSPKSKGSKAPSPGKGTKEPTIGKGKGTPAPLTRKLKNRKVARV